MIISWQEILRVRLARRTGPASVICMVATRSQGRQRVHQEQDTIQAIAARLRTLSPASAIPVSGKLAAVLVPLFEDAAGVVRVWLTQRSKSLSTHQGEVCLPGGKRDEGDISNEATALREANEELALDPADAEVLYKLSPFLSKHYLSVTPVIARVRPDFQPVPNAAEVGAVFSMPLAAFLRSNGHSHRDVQWHGFTYRIHSFQHEGYDVWGLTAAILIKVARLALQREAEFEENAAQGSELTRLCYDGNKLALRQDDQHVATGVPAEPGAPFASPHM